MYSDTQCVSYPEETLNEYHSVGKNKNKIEGFWHKVDMHNSNGWNFRYDFSDTGDDDDDDDDDDNEYFVYFHHHEPVMRKTPSEWTEI